MDVNAARLLRLVKRSGVYVYIRPIDGEWLDHSEKKPGLVWQVTVERDNNVEWNIAKYHGDDLEKVLQEILDEFAPPVKRRRPPRKS